MPRHDYTCSSCETTEERTIKFEEWGEPQQCGRCGGALSRSLSCEGVGVTWHCPGGTHGFAGGGRIPKTPFVKNPGHNPPRLADLGLTNEDGEKLGIH